jgi:hypothetical protein
MIVGCWLLEMILTDPETALPADYIELEKKVDALKLVHQKLLAVT